MPRKPATLAAPAPLPAIVPEAQAGIMEGQHAIACANAAAKELARQIGYDGSLTPGAIEDEIRFYAQQSVISMLECGKRLLLLKELTPHGEFMRRLEMLGISRSSAQRFMQATRKSIKLPTVGNLAERVKNAKAFLELVTHDDDADIEAVAQLDDIERMSASQLRAALREARADREAQCRVLEGKNKRIDALEAKVQRRAAADPAQEKQQAFMLEASHAAVEVMQRLRLLREVFQRIADWSGEQGVADALLAHMERHAERAGAAIVLLRKDFGLWGHVQPTDEEMRARTQEWLAYQDTPDDAQTGAAVRGEKSFAPDGASNHAAD